MAISDAVLNNHASENTKYHALYCYFFLRESKTEMAKIFAKFTSTITTGLTNIYASIYETHLSKD